MVNIQGKISSLLTPILAANLTMHRVYFIIIFFNVCYKASKRHEC